MTNDYDNIVQVTISRPGIETTGQFLVKLREGKTLSLKLTNDGVLYGDELIPYPTDEPDPNAPDTVPASGAYFKYAEEEPSDSPIA